MPDRPYDGCMPRGRPRDDDARQRTLDAAIELVGRDGPGAVTINQIADAAEVSKQTIYRWWPSRTAVVLDALVEDTMRATPFPDTDDPAEDFRVHLRAVAKLFTSPSGAVIRALLADAQSDPTMAKEFRRRFWAPRRELSLARLRRAEADGQIRGGLDLELVLDAVYGPMWIRLFIGHLPLSAADADDLVDAIWGGIAITPEST